MCDYYSVGYSKNFYAPEGVHITNKNESKKLRQLMSETGLTEEELRKDKKYRKLLSNAQTKVGNKGSYIRYLLKLRKKVTKELKLPKEHPLVLERLKEVIEEEKDVCGYYSFRLRHVNARNIINLK